MPDLFRSKLIFSISMRFDVTGALRRAITDSFGGDMPLMSPTMPRNCSTDTARASWSISIIVAQSSMKFEIYRWKVKSEVTAVHADPAAYLALWIYSYGHRAARSYDRSPTVWYRCAHSIRAYTLCTHHSGINVTSAALCKWQKYILMKLIGCHATEWNPIAWA